MISSSGAQERPAEYGESCLLTRRGFIIQTLGVTAAIFALGTHAEADADTLSHAALLPAWAEWGQQFDWRYCGKCHGLFFDGYPDKARCPAGEGHKAIGYNFGLWGALTK
jgi:hypothetical protein